MTTSARDLRRPSTAAVSMMSENTRSPDQPGEYETVARLGRRHTYRGIDGRQLAERDEDLPDWKPAPLRWPFLTVLTAVLFALMAATIYAVQTLPAADSRGALWQAESVASSTNLGDAAGSSDELSRRAHLVGRAPAEVSPAKTSAAGQPSPDPTPGATEKGPNPASSAGNGPDTSNANQGNRPQAAVPAQSEADRQREADERNRQLDEKNKEESDNKNRPGQSPSPTPTPTPTPEPGQNPERSTSTTTTITQTPPTEKTDTSSRSSTSTTTSSTTSTTATTTETEPTRTPGNGFPGGGNSGGGGGNLGDGCSDRRPCAQGVCKNDKCIEESNNGGGGNIGDACSDRRPCSQGAICKDNKCVDDKTTTTTTTSTSSTTTSSSIATTTTSNSSGGAAIGESCRFRPCAEGGKCENGSCVTDKPSNDPPQTTSVPDNGNGGAKIGEKCGILQGAPSCLEGKCVNGVCAEDRPNDDPPSNNPPQNGGVKLDQPCGASAPFGEPKDCAEGTCKLSGLGWKCVQDSNPQPQPQLPPAPKLGDRCGDSVVVPFAPKDCTEGQCRRGSSGVWTCEKETQNPPDNTPPNGGGNDGGLVKLHEKCGGIGYTGPTRCEQGTCKVINPYHSQCVDEGSASEPGTGNGLPKLYDRCGGIGYTGPTTCAMGTCKVMNPYYSQCVDEGPVVVPGTGVVLPKLHEKCGGIGYSGPTTCSQGTCKVVNPYHSQCVDESPVTGPGSGNNPPKGPGDNPADTPKPGENNNETRPGSGNGNGNGSGSGNNEPRPGTGNGNGNGSGNNGTTPGSGGNPSKGPSDNPANSPKPGENNNSPVQVVQLFGQCGGNGYTGPTTCSLGSCVKKDESWSECRLDNPWSTKSDEAQTTRAPKSPGIVVPRPGQEDNSKTATQTTQIRPGPDRNPVNNGQSQPESTRPPLINNPAPTDIPKIDRPKDDQKDEDASPQGGGRPFSPGSKTTSRVGRPAPVPTTRFEWVQVKTITTTDGKGDRTTLISTPTPQIQIDILTTTDSEGRPTVTTITKTVAPRTSTLTDSNGVPTATITEYAAIPTSAAQASTAPVEAMSRLSRSQHFAAFFLPLLLGVGLLAVARMIETTARQLQPFHRMTHPFGAPASESFCQRVGLIETIPIAFRSLAIKGGILRDPPVLLLSKLLLLFSAVLVPLAPEALALSMSETCRAEIGYEGCTASVAIFPALAWAAAGVIATMAVLALLLVVGLQRWTTGVASNPWSNAGMASICANPEVRAILLSLPNGLGARPSAPGKRPPRESTATGRVITHEQLLNAAGDRTFRLGMFPTEVGTDASSLRENASADYGVVLYNSGAEGNSLTASGGIDPDNIGIAISTPMTGTTAMASGEDGVEEFEYSDDEDEDDLGPADNRAPQGAGKFAPLQRQEEHHLPFMMLTYGPRLVFVASACALLIIIMYHQNSSADGGFERFMNQEGFGARLLFTIVGVVIAFFWASFFTNVSLMSPYLMLSIAPQRAERSILISPSSNPFSGLYRAIRDRHFFLAAVAATAILAEAMPILLHNLPSRGDLIASKHSSLYQACTWTSVGILCVMLAVITTSFFVSWPHMPSDPSSPAGAMFYVCDSPGMAWALEGTALLSQRERDSGVRALGMTYEFGAMEGMSGRRRVGVDADETSGAALVDQPEGAVV